MSLSQSHSYTCRCFGCMHDPDPAPAGMVVTDFSDIWRLRADLVDGPILDEVEVEVERHQVERIERVVKTVRTLGLRSWTEESTVTIYRSVRP